MHISNQKNGVHGQLIHHEATGLEDCPVRALGHQVAHTMMHMPNQLTMLGTCYDDHSTKQTLCSNNINQAVKQAVAALQLHQQGTTPKMVGSHLSQSGGTMTAKLNGIDRDTIEKMGCWSSDTFLICMHKKMAHLSSGVSKQMVQCVSFLNIAIVHVINPDNCDED